LDLHRLESHTDLESSAKVSERNTIRIQNLNIGAEEDDLTVEGRRDRGNHKGGVEGIDHIIRRCVELSIGLGRTHFLPPSKSLLAFGFEVGRDNILAMGL
jgi:hypothetical protein